MKDIHRLRVAALVMAVLAVSAARPAMAQERSPVDITGTWRRQPFVINYHFKKLPDGSSWDPTPCTVK